eukprot:TRINITY_DN6065_c0_g1_i1.p1 TRINITY_DN6065_c0_g1~~TRINITY_DN6065_c0_g1_i1.p1  ORF type:complete len:445 (+),score=160.27 TRINITY_DN6065_c0_g1_i1:64-1335(+)
MAPPTQQRAVTKDEYAAALALCDDAARVCLQGREYREAKHELEAELGIAHRLVTHHEDEVERVEAENEKLRGMYEAVKARLASTDLAATGQSAEHMSAKRKVEDLKATRDALAKEAVMLSDTKTLLRSVRSEEDQVAALKRKSAALQEEIGKYRKMEADIEKEHRAHTTLMEADVASQLAELTAEFEDKKASLEKTLAESKRLRQEAEDEWANREAEMEKSAKAEAEAKDKELTLLRNRIEKLLRCQIAAMRERASPERRKRGAKRPAKPPSDLVVHTANVMTEISAGKKILSLEILSKGDAFRSPAYWQRDAPTHAGDLASMDVGVKLSVDREILRPVPLSKFQTYASSIEQQEQLWCFTSQQGAEVVVGLRALAPPANPNRRERVLMTSPSPGEGGLTTTSISTTRLRSPGSPLYTSTLGR